MATLAGLGLCSPTKDAAPPRNLHMEKRRVAQAQYCGNGNACCAGLFCKLAEQHLHGVRRTGPELWQCRPMLRRLLLQLAKLALSGVQRARCTLWECRPVLRRPQLQCYDFCLWLSGSMESGLGQIGAWEPTGRWLVPGKGQLV
ncbi:hypothetical protein MAJ_09687, partial [Metarhizium majus ARSEF 297]